METNISIINAQSGQLASIAMMLVQLASTIKAEMEIIEINAIIASMDVQMEAIKSQTVLLQNALDSATK